MVDLFIHSCHHSTYLLSVSRFDRRDPAKQPLFKPGLLQITLSNYLSNPDSPAHLQQLRASPPKPKYKNPYNRQIHQLVATSEDHAPVDNPYDEYMDYLVHHLETQADIPQTLHRLASPADSSPPGGHCLFCPTETHRFSDCPVFNDEQFKNSLLITLMSKLNQSQRRQKTQDSNVQQIKQLLSSSSPASKSPTPDFHPGQK
jgi:hypothetical protein